MSQPESTVPKFVPPEIGVPFNEKKTLSQMLACDVERHLKNGGTKMEVPPQVYVPRANQIRAGVGSNSTALDQYLMSSE